MFFCRFSYDPVTKRWTLDPSQTSDDLEQSATLRLTSAQQIEEHALVLAIQAAHAHLLGLDDRDEDDTDPSNSLQQGEPDANEELVKTFGINSDGQTKVSAQVFLVCALLHLIGCLLYSGLLATIPMWFVLQASRGGLQKSAADCAFYFSAVAMAVFILRSTLGTRVGEIIRISPVRAARSLLFPPNNITSADEYFRLASAFVFCCCFFLPWLSIHGAIGFSLGMIIMLGSTVLLLALLLCAAHIFRRASAALFFVCLSASFTSPSTIVHFIGGLSDIVVIVIEVFSFLLSLHRVPS